MWGHASDRAGAHLGQPHEACRAQRKPTPPEAGWGTPCVLLSCRLETISVGVKLYGDVGIDETHSRGRQASRLPYIPAHRRTAPGEACRAQNDGRTPKTGSVPAADSHTKTGEDRLSPPVMKQNVGNRLYRQTCSHRCTWCRRWEITSFGSLSALIYSQPCGTSSAMP